MARRQLAPLAAALSMALAPTPAAQQHATASRNLITVKVDPRVELLSVIFRLAGNREYNMAKVDRYAEAVDAHFAPHKNHAAIKLARDLRKRYGVSFDAVMGMAIHLTNATELGELVPFSPHPKSLDKRWKSGSAKRFVRAAKKFVADAKFAEFVEEHSELHATAVERMQQRLRDSAKLDWFDEFFGENPTAKFELALGLLNGGGNYGPHVSHKGGREDLYCILGVWQTDDEGIPTFDEKVISTVVHEFCHSYCNRLVDAHAKKLAKSAKRLWPHVEDAMRRQAYGSWQTMMRESLVRACVIRYMAKTGGPRQRTMQIRNEERRKFLWAGELSDLLIEYEKDRETYPTLEPFMPRIVEFFDDYSKGFGDRMSRAPQVVSMVPEIGDRKVDPDLKEIVITFDRKMRDGSWAFVGGGPKYPKTKGKPRYDDGCRVLRLAVDLEPNHDYEFWLNRGKYDSFASAEGIKLEPLRVTFRTRK